MYGSLKQVDAVNAKSQLHESYRQLLKTISASTPANVGNYIVLKEIGEGSFGKAFLALHKITKTKVVLKSSRKNQPHLVREIHHHRQFKHPHITRLYEIIVTETLVWLVLEYCAGDELYEYLVRHGRMPNNDIRKMFSQLCGAVEYTHRNNCVHRDLKLENILLDKHHNVKLCDFGFTREYERRSLLESVCGTTCYMAPELLLKKKYNGQLVDIWSLGVILYTLLYGEMPFEEDNDIDTKRKVIDSEPSYPDSGVDSNGSALVRRLLSKDPSDRPSLNEILAHPYLADYAQTQIDILETKMAEPFSTKPEKRLLRHFKACHVEVDMMKKSVISNSCDAASGLWELALQKQLKLEARKRNNRGSLNFSRYGLLRLDAEGNLSRNSSLSRAASAAHRTLSMRSRSPRSPFSKVSDQELSPKTNFHQKSSSDAPSNIGNPTDLSVAPTDVNAIPTDLNVTSTPDTPTIITSDDATGNTKTINQEADNNNQPDKEEERPPPIRIAKETEMKDLEASPSIETVPDSVNAPSSITSNTAVSSLDNKKTKNGLKYKLLKLVSYQKYREKAKNSNFVSKKRSDSTEKVGSIQEDTVNRNRKEKEIHDNTINKFNDIPTEPLEKSESVSEFGPIPKARTSRPRPLSQLSQLSAFSQFSQYSGSQLSSVNSQASRDGETLHNSSLRFWRPSNSRISASSSFSSLVSIRKRHFSKHSSISSGSSHGLGGSRENSLRDLDDSLNSLGSPNTSKFSTTYVTPRNGRNYNESAVLPRRRSALVEAFSSLTPNRNNDRQRLNSGNQKDKIKVEDIPETAEED